MVRTSLGFVFITVYEFRNVTAESADLAVIPVFSSCCSGGKKSEPQTALNGGSSSIKVLCSLLHMSGFQRMFGFIMMVSVCVCVE